MTDIDYSGRPNKSLVRSRIFQLTEEKLKPEHKHSENLSFITFSGFRFVDSIVFYNQFNIRNIYSIENDARLYKRSVFNRPYEFIEITPGEVTDFIDEKFEEVIGTKKVIHLDYESTLRDNIVFDIEALFAAGFFDKDGLLFITFHRGFNKSALTSKVSDIIPDDVVSKETYNNWLSTSFSDIVLHQIQRKYQKKKTLKEILKVFYQDTSPMVVVGYYIRNRRAEEHLITRTRLEEFTLPVLTFMESNYIFNHLDIQSSETADYLGLLEGDVENFKKYA